MGLDNDASDHWKFQGTKGNVLDIHNLISLGEQGNELEIRIDLFSHPGCAIYLVILDILPFKVQFPHIWNEVNKSIYLLEETPIKCGLTQSGYFFYIPINLSVSGFGHCFSCYTMLAATYTLLTFYFTILGIYLHVWCLWLQNGCCSARHHTYVIPYYFSCIREQRLCHALSLYPVSNFLFRSHWLKLVTI